MGEVLRGKTVAVLTADGFNLDELQTAKRILERAGAWVDVVAPKRGWILSESDAFDGAMADFSAGAALADDFDALYIPDGRCIDDLLQNKQAVAFVQDFFELERPVATSGRGVAMFLAAGVVRGRRLTSAAALLLARMTAGAKWLDFPVVQDLGLITAQSSESLPRFLPAFIRSFSERSFPQTACDIFAG